MSYIPLLWRHNGRDGVSNHQPHDCSLSRSFRPRSKKTSKLRVTGLCAGNSPATSEFPAQMASYAENVSIWWRHNDTKLRGETSFFRVRSCHIHMKIVQCPHVSVSFCSIHHEWFCQYWHIFESILSRKGTLNPMELFRICTLCRNSEVQLLEHLALNVIRYPITVTS